MKKFSGSITALVTPFKEGEVDYKSLASIVDWQIAEGTDGLLACGTTGEGITLSREEWLNVIALVKRQANGLVPVMAGIHCNGSAKALERAIEVGRANIVDGLLVTPPQFNKPSYEGIVLHYQKVSEAGVPIIIYNVPQRGVINMPASLICKLAKIPGVIGLKDDDADMRKYMMIRRDVGPSFAMLSGCDYSALAFNNHCGDGCISVVSNVFPRLYAALQKCTLSGDFNNGAVIDKIFSELYIALYSEVNPIPVKYAMSYIGKCSEEVRLPMIAAQDDTRKAVRMAVDRIMSKHNSEYMSLKTLREPLSRN